MVRIAFMACFVKDKIFGLQHENKKCMRSNGEAYLSGQPAEKKLSESKVAILVLHFKKRNRRPGNLISPKTEICPLGTSPIQQNI